MNIPFICSTEFCLLKTSTTFLNFLIFFGLSLAFWGCGCRNPGISVWIFGIGAESETWGVNKGKLLYPSHHFHVLSVWSARMKGVCHSPFIPSHFVPDRSKGLPFICRIRRPLWKAAPPGWVDVVSFIFCSKF